MNKIIIKTNKTFFDIAKKERDTKEIKSFFICINNHIIDTNKKTVIKKALKEFLMNNEISLDNILNTKIQIFLYTLWFYHGETLKIKDLFTINIK